MNNIKTINILGTDYQLKFVEEMPEEIREIGETAGAVDVQLKEIYIIKAHWDIDKTIRHELIHAFLRESGLDSNSEWARNEEIVDWFALQFDKIDKGIKEVK